MEKYLSVKDVADALGATERAIWQRIYKGQIPFRRWNRRILIPADELERFLSNLPGQTAAEAISELTNAISTPESLGDNLCEC